MPTTTVQMKRYEGRDGQERTQYVTTIPKGLAEAFELGGSKIDWTAHAGDALRVKKVSE